MTPTYQDSSPSPFPIAISEDHEQDYHHLYSSSLSSHVFTYPIQDQQGFYQEVEANTLASEVLPSESSHGLKLRLWAKKNRHDQNQSDDQSGSAEWMPSNRKLVQNAMNSDRPGSDAPNNIVAQMKIEDHKQQAPSPVGTDNSSNNSSSSNSNIPIRVCADCNTTKTPLWRSGPRGPKSLCNACGIRQRKARRAVVAAAAAAAGKGTVFVAESSVQHKGKKRLKNGSVAKYKKRTKQATNTSHVVKKVCFEDFLISLGKNLAFQSVFPQDEKEAAILLMALSCGLVHG